MSVIRIPESVWTRLHRHLYSTPGEHFAFLRARWGRGASGPVFIVHDALLVPDDRVRFGRGGYQMTIDGILDVVNAVVPTNDALVEVHNHGGQRPRFSRTDRDELPDFVSYMLDSLPARPYAATVWGDDSVYGEWFDCDGRSGVVRSVTVLGDRLRQVVSRDDDGASVPETFDRQLPWFTESGQQMLGRLRVAVVGGGGTGSHIIQNLVYLGVRDFVIVEYDVAEATNMNRLVTAKAADLGTPKGILALRLIQSVAPDATVQLEPVGLPSPGSLGLLKEVDVIFGCVDNDGPRLVLNAIAVAYGIPYFDLASGIHAPDAHVQEAGGRLAAVFPGGPCLNCMGELDMDEARHWLRSPEARRFAEARGYVRGIAVTAPAVVSLNGAIAAAAVNEFAMLVSGVRPVTSCTDVDLLGTARGLPGQWATPRRVKRQERCLECTTTGAADAADVERFLRRRMDGDADVSAA